MKTKESISILGVRTELTSIERNALKGLNVDMLLRFSFYTAVFNGQSLCIIKAKKEETITPTKYKRITEQIESVVGIPVAVWLENPMMYIERDRLINQGVYFIVSDKYAFLPSLIVNAQLKRKEKPSKLIPAAQYILLLYLLDKKADEKYTLKILQDITPYNYVAVARAVANIEGCNLCRTETDSKGTKLIHFGSKHELWEKAQQYLSSPIKDIFYTDVKPNGDFSISGINALAHYSHLNPEQYDTLAIWDRLFNPSDRDFNEVEGLYKIEVWKYPTTFPQQANSKFVDKISLYLAMKNEPDPRIEKELEIMIEERIW